MDPDPQPGQRRGGDRRRPRDLAPVTTRAAAPQGLHHDDDHRAQTQSQPGCVHALEDRGPTITGPEIARRPRQSWHRREKPAQSRSSRAPGCRWPEPRQRQRSKSAYHRKIEQQVQRLGGRTPKRGQHQRRDPPAPPRGWACLSPRSSGPKPRATPPRRRRWSRSRITSRQPVTTTAEAGGHDGQIDVALRRASNRPPLRVDLLEHRATSACCVVRTMSTMLSTSSGREPTQSW